MKSKFLRYKILSGKNRVHFANKSQRANFLLHCFNFIQVYFLTTRLLTAQCGSGTVYLNNSQKPAVLHRKILRQLSCLWADHLGYGLISPCLPPGSPAAPLWPGASCSHIAPICSHLSPVRLCFLQIAPYKICKRQLIYWHSLNHCYFILAGFVLHLCFPTPKLWNAALSERRVFSLCADNLLSPLQRKMPRCSHLC